MSPYNSWIFCEAHALRKGDVFIALPSPEEYPRAILGDFYHVKKIEWMPYTDGRALWHSGMHVFRNLTMGEYRHRISADKKIIILDGGVSDVNIHSYGNEIEDFIYKFRGENIYVLWEQFRQSSTYLNSR
jgi:hypothetical protein